MANIKDESPSLEAALLHQSTEEIGFHDEAVEGQFIEEAPTLTEFELVDPEFASHEQEQTHVAEDSIEVIYLRLTIVSTEEHTSDDVSQYKIELPISDEVFPLYYFIH